VLCTVLVMCTVSAPHPESTELDLWRVWLFRQTIQTGFLRWHTLHPEHIAPGDLRLHRRWQATCALAHTTQPGGDKASAWKSVNPTTFCTG